MTWTAEAYRLADTEEQGYSAAAYYAAGCAAGLDQDALRGLIGAALALGAPLSALLASIEPWHKDRDMTAAVEDLAAEIGARRRAVAQMTERVEDALAAAYVALAAAQNAQPEPDTGALAAALQQIADCETALEILRPLADRLAYALARLAQVPADMGEVYKAPQRHVRAGGVLPYDGRWLTGTGRAS